LHVRSNANQEEIKRSYRRLAMSVHPDKNPSPDSKLQFQKIQEAYRTLGNFEKRKKYDAWLLYGGSVLQNYGTQESGHERDRRRSRGQTVRNKPGYQARNYTQKKHEPDHDFTKLETYMFYSLLIIGIAAIFLAIRDLIWGEWTGINSLTGIIFGLSFTILLAFTYYTFYKKKD
jgi:curved DNA-binding protein CbpA